jgi:hypothetical protein
MDIRCGSAPVMTIASIRMRVTDADVIGDEWRATELEGSIVERSRPQLGCRGSQITYSFTGSVTPTPFFGFRTTLVVSRAVHSL